MEHPEDPTYTYVMLRLTVVEAVPGPIRENITRVNWEKVLGYDDRH